MTMMNYYQYRGMLGELAAIEGLLSFGMSVNSLTGSDFGWDLHAQLPEGHAFAEGSPIVEDLDQKTKSWQLSGRSAHFQIKAVSEAATLALPVDTLERWIAGSKFGSPTFLLVHEYGLDTERKQAWLLTPFGLAASLSRGVRGAKTHSLKYSDPEFSIPFITTGPGRNALWARLDLWTRVPALMSNAETLIPLPGDYHRGGWRKPSLVEHVSDIPNTMDYDHRVIKLLAELTYSYLTCFEPQNIGDHGRTGEVVRRLAQNYSNETSSWSDKEPVNVWIVNTTREKSAAEYANLLIPPGCFTASLTKEHALQDLEALARRLGFHAPHFEDRL